MAKSPTHAFGQMIGDLLEEIMLPVLQQFCDARGLYLDKKGHRALRKGKKVTWLDAYKNSHDLDFVIEREGTEEKTGHPVAFIEAAWRRYTKHSKNKAQEIQGALLPIVEKYAWDTPFLGAILAGLFTEPSVRQMESAGFHIALFSYESILGAFQTVGLDVRFDESTPDAIVARMAEQMKALSKAQRTKIKDRLVMENRTSIDAFLENLRTSLDRHLCRLTFLPLYGKSHVFTQVAELKAFLQAFTPDPQETELVAYRIEVVYSNGSHIQSEFHTKDEIYAFLEYLAS